MTDSIIAPSVRVLCVDDSADILTLMQRLIEVEPGMDFAGGLESADGLVAKVRCLIGASEAAPLVVLLDATMPGEPPLKAVLELAAELPQVRVVMFSGYNDPEFVHAAIAAGAWGCISKDAEPRTILRRVQDVASSAVRQVTLRP